MTTTTEKLLTADDLLRLYSEGTRGELIRGVLYETVSTGLEHGEVVANLMSPLHNFVRPRRLGRVIGSDAGIQLESDPDTVREPDIAFISATRLPLDTRVTGYSQVVPDLVVEVVSPNDRMVAVHDKIQMWLRFGVRLALMVDPASRTVLAFAAEGSAQTFAAGDVLDFGDVVPGFTYPVLDVFDT